jgi:branched-chain amino acid transport system ATP-binding protein
MTERLRVQNLSKNFGGLKVASDINFTLQSSERTALIGPNGAGKTTLVNLISGALAQSSGTILLDEVPIDALSQAARARAGIVRTFQIGRLCQKLTVLENLRLPLIQREGVGFQFWSSRSLREAMDQEALEYLRQLGVDRLAHMQVSQLAYGQQRLIEIGIALAMKPRILLLDEPAAGVPESESNLILEAIDNLPADLPVLLIEHDMDLVFRFARRVIVLVNGEILMDGTPDQVAADQRVREVYFGNAA